jgi:hypothetical protein
MVSGLVTSPNEFSKISSGEARPMVIFVKLFFTFVSFLKAMLSNIYLLTNNLVISD